MKKAILAVIVLSVFALFTGDVWGQATNEERISANDGRQKIHPKLPAVAILPNGARVSVPDPTGWRVDDEHFQVLRNKKIIYVEKLEPADVILGRFNDLVPGGLSPAVFKVFYPLNEKNPVLVQWTSDGENWFAILFNEDGSIIASMAGMSGMGPTPDRDSIIFAYIEWQGKRLAERSFDFPK